MKQKNNQKGFTLVEMLLVVLLLALTVGLTSDMLLSLIRSNTKTQVINEIEQQANFVALKLEKELRDALDVTTVGSTRLNITLRSNSQVSYRLNTTTPPYYLQRDVSNPDVWVRLTDNSIPGGVRVTCPSGVCFSILGSNPKAVVTTMDFEQAQSSAGMSYSGKVEIRSTITIRGDYK